MGSIPLRSIFFVMLLVTPLNSGMREQVPNIVLNRRIQDIKERLILLDLDTLCGVVNSSLVKFDICGELVFSATYNTLDERIREQAKHYKQ